MPTEPLSSWATLLDDPTWYVVAAIAILTGAAGAQGLRQTVKRVKIHPAWELAALPLCGLLGALMGLEFWRWEPGAAFAVAGALHPSYWQHLIPFKRTRDVGDSK